MPGAHSLRAVHRVLRDPQRDLVMTRLHMDAAMHAPTPDGARMHDGTTVPQTEAGTYRPDVDGLRAVAILSVLAFHAFPQWLPGGFIGVDVFFVISGFLISRIVFTGLAAGTFSFRHFYARRVRRIFPSLTAILVPTLGLGWIIQRQVEYAQLGKHVSDHTLWCAARNHLLTFCSRSDSLRSAIGFASPLALLCPPSS